MPSDSNERLYSITRARAVTASPNTDLAINGVYPRGLMVGTAGDVTGTLADDAVAVTLPGLAAGVWHPVSFKIITAIPGTTFVGY